MNFQQLRIVRETVRRNFNLTEVANALFTSQSGVSKHIKDLEDELGVELFVRRGKRLLGLTDPGKELVEIVTRVLADTASIKRLSEQFSNRQEGQLVIATTHTQARYVLPHVVAGFRTAYPKVRLTLHQGSPTEIASMISAGDADIGICTETLREVPGLTTFPFYSWHHGVVVPRGHALEKVERLTLQAIAEWPIITYHEGFTGRRNVDRTFADAGLAPDIVMSAMDTDVLKAYVELGLGVGIIAAMAFDPKRDTALRLIDGSHLFEANTFLLSPCGGAATCATMPTASSSCARRHCPKGR
jgi:LysR family transcriptional regulator, cys regulon transcriptional activator